MTQLLGFLIFFAIFLVFIVMNLENLSDVNIGFVVFKNTPVYITAFISFFLGMLCAIPFFAVIKKKKKKTAVTPAGNEPAREAEPKKGFRLFGRKKKDTPSSNESGEYGID